MPRGQLYINGVDVFEQYGVSLDDQALSQLMTPAAMKDLPSNKSRLADGCLPVLNAPRKKSERTFNLTGHIVARTQQQFFNRYDGFTDFVASSPLLTIRTSFQPNTYYRCTYQSCSQFTQFMRGIAKFSLKLIEWNPANRGATDINN